MHVLCRGKRKKACEDGRLAKRRTTWKGLKVVCGACSLMTPLSFPCRGLFTPVCKTSVKIIHRSCSPAQCAKLQIFNLGLQSGIWQNFLVLALWNVLARPRSRAALISCCTCLISTASTLPPVPGVSCSRGALDADAYSPFCRRHSQNTDGILGATSLSPFHCAWPLLTWAPPEKRHSGLRLGLKFSFI